MNNFKLELNKILPVCLVLIMVLFNQIELKAQDEISISNPDLRDTMLLLLSLDVGAERFQKELSDLKATALSGYVDSLFSLPAREQRIFAAKRFKEIVAKNGLPQKEEIGTGRAFESLLLLTVHSGDKDFMKAHLAELKELFAPASIAVLEDKISVLEDLPQVYGSQAIFSKEEGRAVFYKIIDPQNVDKRRADVGLAPLETYAKEIGVDWEKEKLLLFK